MGVLIKTAQNVARFGQHKYHHKDSIAELANDTGMCAGSNYIVGDNFIAEVLVFALSYYSNRLQIWERDKENIDAYMQARTDLLKRGAATHCNKTLDGFLGELNLNEGV